MAVSWLSLAHQDETMDDLLASCNAAEAGCGHQPAAV
jgi:hypothetical protein